MNFGDAYARSNERNGWVGSRWSAGKTTMSQTEPETPCCTYRDHIISYGVEWCPCSEHDYSDLHPFGAKPGERPAPLGPD